MSHNFLKYYLVKVSKIGTILLFSYSMGKGQGLPSGQFHTIIIRSNYYYFDEYSREGLREILNRIS